MAMGRSGSQPEPKPDAERRVTVRRTFAKDRVAPLLESFSSVRHRAFGRSLEAKHRETTEAHLAAALLREDAVRRAVSACGADVDDIEALVEGTVDQERRRPWWAFGRTRESVALLSLYDRALMHAMSAELERVSPVMLLIRIVEAAPPSLVAERLRAFDLEAERLKLWVAHGRVDDEALPRGAGRASLRMMNDPFTTMEAVMSLLRSHLDVDEARAERLMRRVHEGGSAVVGRGPWDWARQKAEAIVAEARAMGFPLAVRVEAEDQR